MVSITKIYEFEAAHHLPNHKGACHQLHGHSYRLEITISGPIQIDGPSRGMVMDFSVLKGMVESLPINYLDKLDHSNLNDYYDNPTAEIMVQSIARDMRFMLWEKSITLERVRLWETRTSYATWEKGQNLILKENIV